MSDRGSGGEFFVGFFIGAIVGGIAALLFTPLSGEETRQLVQDRGIELKDRATDLSAQARERAEQLQEQGRIVLDEQRGKISQAIEEGKDAATQKREELLGKLSSEEAAA